MGRYGDDVCLTYAPVWNVSSCGGGGQIPLNAEGEKSAFGSLAEQTTQCLQNLTALCQAAGTDLGMALRMTVYTTQLEGFAEINEAYGAFFGDAPPARVTIGVAALPMGANVEIDAVVGIRAR